MRKVVFITLFGILLSIIGCSKNAKVTMDPNFIPVDSLISARITRMDQGEYRLKKTVTYEDTTLVHTVDSPDLDRELAPFTKVLIPVVSWNNNYITRIDTAGDRIIYLYEAKDSSVDLSRFALHCTLDGRVRAMHFNYRTSNLFTKSDQFLIWEEDMEGNLHYRIEGKQHTRIFGEEIYKIEGLLSKNIKD